MLLLLLLLVFCIMAFGWNDAAAAFEILIVLGIIIAILSFTVLIFII